MPQTKDRATKQTSLPKGSSPRNPESPNRSPYNKGEQRKHEYLLKLAELCTEASSATKEGLSQIDEFGDIPSHYPDSLSKMKIEFLTE